MKYPNGSSPWSVADLEGIPAAPSLAYMCEGFKFPADFGKLHISIPCAGIVGTKAIFEAMGCAHEYVNVFDIEAAYEPVYRAMGLDHSSVGPIKGDVCRAALADIPLSDILCAGPPCPPWAGNGQKASLQDDRSDVFVSIIKMVIHMIKADHLKICVLENVGGILKAINGKEPLCDVVLRSLRESASEFIWDHVVLKLQDYNYPQERLRVFIRGMHKALCEWIPPPSPSPPGIKRRLAQVLHPSLPHVPLKDMPASKRKNLRDLEYRLKVMMRTEPHKFEDDSVVVVSLDRRQESAWGQRITIDMAPTLTTSNVWLFVLSVDLHLPLEQRAFHRYLHPVERLTLQGFAKSVAENFAVGESKLLVKAAGNAYPPALIAAAIAPMLKCMIRHHKGHESFTRVAAKSAAVAFKLQKMRPKRTEKEKAQKRNKNTKKKKTVTI